MSSIINATTTNGLKFQPDNSGSLVLQTNNGTTAVTIDTSQNATFTGTLTATGKLTSSSLPTGSVLQVVQGTLSTTPSTNSTTYVTTGLAATITPKSSTSKILIIANGSYYSGSAGNTYYTIYRGSTNLEITATRGFAEANFAAGTGGIMTVSYLDSPATTSATTYTIYTKQNALVYFPVDGSTAAITLMEIAA